MRIVITGASGVIGQTLVKDYLTRGAKLLLVGRNPEKLLELFPGIESCGFEEIESRAENYDAILHLAVMNNNVSATRDDFIRDNVDLTKEVLHSAQKAGIKRFVYVSTIQALDPHNQSHYASSKRMASSQLAAEKNLNVHILYLAAVVGEKLTGRMAPLNHVPALLRTYLFEFLAAISPVTDIATVAEACWEALTGENPPREQIVVRDQSQNLAFKVIKRGIDIAIALIILIPFFWVLVIIWLAIRLQSPGPGIFAQPRIGLNGQVFTCYKFRTMADDSPHVGTHEVSTALVTRTGRLLRRTKLDELPQAINILKNQMSLVGPRPCLPNQVDVIAARRKRGVFDIKPGITGLAQIRQVDMSNPELLALWDLRYLKLRSLRLDFSILLQTALGRGNGDAMARKQ